MPLQATSGAASYDAFGGGVPVVPNYIEDVFSTYLVTGSTSSKTISNGIDLSTKGGMVWTKWRIGASSHYLYDTARGTTKYLSSNTTTAQTTLANTLTAFNTDGFTLGSEYDSTSSGSYATWTFRKQPKFFDVVTYTGNGVSSRTIAHSLDSAPGCVIIKNLTSIGNWSVWHRGNGTTDYTAISLNLTNASGNVAPGNYPDFTSTTFKPSAVQAANTGSISNLDGDNYVAYLFAHNAGGFGLTGTDNVISCGSYTGNGSATGPTVTLGYEPQWLLIKDTTGANDWVLIDNMRGLVVGGAGKVLYPNDSLGEYTETFISPRATGFNPISTDSKVNASGRTYIYIAIRRGPMKVPTDATKVFDTQYAYSSSPTYRNTILTDGFIQFAKESGYNKDFYSRLTGTNYLSTNSTAAESTNASLKMDIMNGVYTGVNTPPTYLAWMFKRAPSFFDEVCYTGNDVLRTINHNLGVAPEMMIIKCRDAALDWAVYHTGIGNTKYIFLNSTAASVTASSYWNNTSPTSSVFTVNTSNKVNSSPSPYVAYLFATCAGVSKVGSYTGTGTTLQVDCGFTGGARFVLIKRTDSTGDWYVWDSARGIVAGNDPYLLLNSTAAEVTNTDYIDTYSAGFEISSTAPAAINANGGTFIFLAIA